MNVDEQQFARLVREHKRTIYTVCYMFSGDEEEVRDLFQEILVKLWIGFPKFNAESSLRTWIYTVSLNTCISIERKKNRPKTVSMDLETNLFGESGEDMRQISMLHDRITQLRPFDRAIVLLWLENIPYDEIGKIVGISPSAVGVRLFRIKEQLKKI